MTVFHVFSLHILILNLLRHAALSSCFPPQDAVFHNVTFHLAHKIFMFYIKGAVKFKFPARGAKGLMENVVRFMLDMRWFLVVLWVWTV